MRKEVESSRESEEELAAAPAKRANQTRKKNKVTPNPLADPRPHPHRRRGPLPPIRPSTHPTPPRAAGQATSPPHGREQEEQVGGLGGGGRHLRRPHARHARHPAERGLPRLRRPAHPLPRY